MMLPGHALCRAEQGLFEDAPRKLLFNFLVVIFALEFVNETDLIAKTSALMAPDTHTPIMSPSQQWSSVQPMVSQTKVVTTSIAMSQHRQKKPYLSPSALSSVHSPFSVPSNSSISGASDLAFDSLDLSDPSVQRNRRSAEDIPHHMDAALPDAAPNTSAVSPQDGCCAPNMVQRRGSQNCQCVYPIRVELFLHNVSLNSNWSTEFLEELASQLNLRVTQFEIVNFYVVGTSGLNMTIDIGPHTGNSFSSDQATAMNYSLSMHTVRINPVLVGDYSLVNLMWFRPVAPAPGHGYSKTEFSTGHGYSKTRIKIYAIAGSSSIFMLLFALWLGYTKCRSKRKSKERAKIESFLQKNGTIHPKRYTYVQVKRMTRSFAEKLGQGGFGAVYRGDLSDGRRIAVKMLKDYKTDGDDFINEVASISRTSHVNVVTLLGFCLEGSKRALIYDYMPNGSLEKYAFKDGYKGGNTLGWEKLLDIAVGIARGLEYLHRGCNTRIVHFDIKPHNILLDQNFCPKISDFGLAKQCINKESVISIGGARGTIGYIAPEVYSKQFGAVSTKSDVYSYGMMVLEMVGAKDYKNITPNSESSSQYFPQWIYEHLDEYCVSASEINGETSEIVRKMIVVGLWCIQLSSTDRPTMTRVVEMLEGSTINIELPPTVLFS
ncbi:LEAF RUST 10 DISEASE-RESISTANCE LOCUS RECEPTOR-LIKE PROTEIN KINASE-like 2.4 [Triticum dicoccoides]|uniref:LEAF RUST 10 DISEASE-RESISTANCE LOCUS RECEPTOR-LIKE PROTEIN KINASE-like 2.4 n=1 Tax=Triticum dicoccoides TaxID=85692 RepID=UPI0018910140|nr:LEAF RUST 10 DISEASE-RESISTANCE LOCUS RECEPTOR-LIKE PROTEIN KINASE-like 2.4 [Triticum dicoccoides]